MMSEALQRIRRRARSEIEFRAAGGDILGDDVDFLRFGDSFGGFGDGAVKAGICGFIFDGGAPDAAVGGVGEWSVACLELVAGATAVPVPFCEADVGQVNHLV